MSSAFDSAFKVTGALTIGSSLLTGNLKSGLAAAVTILLQNRNKAKLNTAQSLGVEPPVDTTSKEIRDYGASVVTRLATDKSQVQTYLKLEEFRQNVEQTIIKFEEKLSLQIETQVKTQSGDMNAPLKMPDVVRDAHLEYVQYLGEANRILSFELDLVSQIINSAKVDQTKKDLVNDLNFITQWRETIEIQVQKVRNKISKWYSLSLIIENVQKKNFIIQKLAELVPEAMNYLAVGISVADLLATPGGLMGKIREVIDLEKDNYSKLFNAWQDIIRKFPQYKQIDEKYVSQGPTFNGPGLTENLFSAHPAQERQQPQDQSYNLMNVRSEIEHEIEKFELRINNAKNSNNYQEISEIADDLYEFANAPKYYDPPLNRKEINRIKSYFLQAKSEIQVHQETRNASIIFNGLIIEKSVKTASDTPSNYNFITNSQNNSASTPVTQTSSGTASTTMPSSGSGEQYSIQKQVNEEIGRIFNTYGVLPGKSSTELMPEQMVASLRRQMRDVKQIINQLEGIYIQILKNPTDLGGLSSFVSTANSNNRFIKVATEEFQPKFKKVGDENVVESDKRFRDYWDKELGYGPWGTTVDEKPEHSDKTYEEEKELHPNRTSKFKKI
jgi:predicted component of type VI protein secretion system